MPYESAATADVDRSKQKALRSIQVELEPIGLTEHRRRYRVTYAGETLVEGRRNPIIEARRALTGRREVWHRGKTSADMQLDVERDAGLAMKETATESLRIVTWEPWRLNSDDRARRPGFYRRRQPPDDDATVGGIGRD